MEFSVCVCDHVLVPNVLTKIEDTQGLSYWTGLGYRV